MQTTQPPPICKAQKRFWFFHGAFVSLLVIGATAFPAEPTAKDEAGVVGSWRVSGKDFERRYDISAGRNVKIVGAGIKDRRGRLTPQQDGSYLVQLDGDEVLRLAFTQANDQLVVECFNKKNFSLGLSPMWKITAVRMQPPNE